MQQEEYQPESQEQPENQEQSESEKQPENQEQIIISAMKKEDDEEPIETVSTRDYLTMLLQLDVSEKIEWNYVVLKKYQIKKTNCFENKLYQFENKLCLLNLNKQSTNNKLLLVYKLSKKSNHPEEMTVLKMENAIKIVGKMLTRENVKEWTECLERFVNKHNSNL